MAGIQNRAQQAVSEELPELPITGPFGGVQSEMSLTAIEPYGFADTKNVIFRQGVATVRPGYTALPAMPNPQEAILGIADFFDINGVHHQVVFTQTRLLSWNPQLQTWTVITGAAFTGSSTQTFSWDVVNYKLCFSQGADKIWSWDGIAVGYVQTSANAPAAKYIAEIGLHLVALNTLEGGLPFPNRYRFSGIGDPTDWTSVNAGVSDQLNNLGPGAGLIKLGQQGFGFHQNGVVQVIPTGIGVAPFFFYPIINAAQGLPYPFTLTHLDLEGQELAVYHTYDNVQLFNGTSIIPIGDAPIDGRRRLGARSRILADIKRVNTTQPFGFVTYAINGVFFKAYWLVIPGISVWVYNFDEGNWTYFTYDRVPQVVGNFINPTAPRWLDALGTWQAANYSWASIVSNPGNDFALGFSDGTIGLVDFTNFSESAWQIVSAKHTFGDRRHKHTVKKFRLVVKDLGPVTYTVTMTNESNVTVSKDVTLGTGSGDDLSAILDINIIGLRLQWTVSGPVKASGSFVEFAPMFTVGGEQRGGSADGN
jgi:hypothetical protein